MSAPSPQFQLPNRPLTWFITGCSSGFGLLLARLVLANGHRVIASSRNPSRTPDLVAEITGSPGNAGRGKWVQLDVDDPDCAGVLRRLEDEEGEIVDVLVNNGGNGVHGAYEQFDEGGMRRLMETHYFGPCRLISEAVPRMRGRRLGIIINVASGAALDGVVSMGPYGAAKAALHLTSKVLAKELAPFNIRVLTVCPGGFNTNMPLAANSLEDPPLPRDYEGTPTKGFVDAVKSRAYVAPGDPQKAVAAMYEAAMLRDGAGARWSGFLPLGEDIAGMVGELQEYYAHSMEVYGEVCRGVVRDDLE